jgi:membrane protein
MAGAQLFGLYVRRAAISTLYGALGLLPLFLLWLWVTWLIVLFGLELAYALQAMKEGRFAWRSYYEGDQIIIDRTLILPLATRIAQAFQEGEVAKVATLTRQLRLPPAAVLRLLRALQSAGLVHEVHEGRQHGYVLARPAETIQADEVLLAGRSIMPAAGARGEDASWGIVNELYQELQKSVNEISLAELARGEVAEPA